MTRAWGKRVMIMALLLLAACRPPTLSVTPTQETIPLQVASTASTRQLLQDLASGYQDVRQDVRIAFQFPVYSLPRLLETVTSTGGDTTPEPPRYGLTDYLPPDTEVWAAPIAHDALVIITHPDLPISSLTTADLRAIYAGRVTNWTALEGPDLPITVISRESGASSRQIFDDQIMTGGPTPRRHGWPLPAPPCARSSPRPPARLATNSVR
jgi:hypothetical protein